MKKGLIAVVIVILVVVLGIYFYNSGGEPEPTPTPSNCAGAGETSAGSPMPDTVSVACCEGLVELSGDLQYAPDKEFADEDGCALTVGSGSFCSDCGNEICEDWENPCSCPSDCPK